MWTWESFAIWWARTERLGLQYTWRATGDSPSVLFVIPLTLCSDWVEGWIMTCCGPPTVVQVLFTLCGNILIILKRNNIGCCKSKLIWTIFKNSVFSAKKTQHSRITKIITFMLFRDIIVVYFEDQMKLINTFFFVKCKVKTGGRYCVPSYALHIIDVWVQIIITYIMLAIFLIDFMCFV